MNTALRILVTVVILLASTAIGRAQAVSVKQYIQQVSAGWTSDAKKALPDLLIDQPDDPAVLFLHASLVEDPKKATPLLERIISAHPRSEWADDALSRLIIFAATKNDPDRAKKLFNQMRDQYSSSDLLPVVYDVMRSTVGAPAPSERPATAPPKAAEPVVREQPASQKSYTLVTRATFSKEEADTLLEQFKKKRMRARITTDTAKGKTRYIVSVGEYETEPEALKDVEAVNNVCKCKPTVTKR